MRNRILITCLSLTLMITAAACGSSAAETTEPEAPAPVEEKEPEPEPEPESVEEPEEEPAEPEEEIEEGKIYYDDEFTKADDYAKYGEDGDAKAQDLIWVEGTIEDYNKTDKYLTLTAQEGQWQVSVGGNGTDYYYDMIKEVVGKKVRVFGTYTGYSKELSMPTIAFQPKDYYNYAFRLETVDNKFRLTQLDYRFEEPKLDSEVSYGRLTFKESSAWQGKMVDGSLMYYTSDVIPAIIMGHFEDVQKAFDEIDEDEYLSSLADNYVASDDEIITKEPFKFEGYPALCFENTWSDDDLPMPMSLYCYMFIVDDQYYYFGCGEPYLVGESSKRILPAMLKDFKVGSEIVTEPKSGTDKDTDKKASEEKEKEVAKTQEAETPKEAEKPAEPEPAQETAEVKTSPYPTKDELMGKVFSQTLNATLTGKNGEGSHSGTEELPDILMTAGDLANYNESTGVLAYTTSENGETMSFNMKFTKDANGKISYTGSMSVDAPQYTGEGTVSGSER